MRTELRALRAPAMLLASAALLAPLGGCGPNRTRPTNPSWNDDAAVTPLDCVPNLDGQIAASELEPSIGTAASYLVSPSGETRGVDLVGQVDGDGVRRWDLGTDYASDRAARITASELAGKWYASSFPTGEFVTPSDASGALEYVYRLDDSGFYLLGFASSTESPAEGQTLYVYSTPIVLFQLPLTVGASWITTSEVRNATVRGIPYAGRDTYASSVVSSGELTLPDLTFQQAMRVTTHVTIEPSAGEAVQRRQTSFLFECFGEVARVVSSDGESNDDFTTAAEMRRFGL